MECVTPENTENNDGNDLTTGSVTAMHADSVTGVATELRDDPDRETFSRLLVTYDTAIAVTKDQHGPKEINQLIDAVASVVADALAHALDSEGFDVVRRDLYQSFNTHELYDAPDSTTLFTEALARETVSESLTDDSDIPDDTIDYLIMQSESRNPRARTAATAVGWAVNAGKTESVSRILDLRDGRISDDDQIIEILRHALHANQYAIADSIQSNMKDSLFEEAAQKFREDHDNGEVPLPESIKPDAAPNTPEIPSEALLDGVSNGTATRTE